ATAKILRHALCVYYMEIFVMKGDFVILRAFGGPIVRRVVAQADEIVFIASDEQFSLLVNGLPALEPVGFHRRDVFQYAPTLEKEIARGKVDWTRLTPYAAQA
ncbi:MAG: hypothetical protein AABM33_06020, partial [Pseudomonadota bacterium]